MVGVIFLRRWRLWNEGMKAGFPEEQAARLVKLGVAVLDKAAMKPKPAKDA